MNLSPIYYCTRPQTQLGLRISILNYSKQPYLWIGLNIHVLVCFFHVYLKNSILLWDYSIMHGTGWTHWNMAELVVTVHWQHIRISQSCSTMGLINKACHWLNLLKNGSMCNCFYTFSKIFSFLDFLLHLSK